MLQRYSHIRVQAKRAAIAVLEGRVAIVPENLTQAGRRAN
jgi:hypothetical protein